MEDLLRKFIGAFLVEFMEKFLKDSLGTLKQLNFVHSPLEKNLKETMNFLKESLKKFS